MKLFFKSFIQPSHRDHRLSSTAASLFRAIYRVASVQPVVSTHSAVFTRPSPHLSSLPPPVSTLPAQCSLAMGAEPLSQQQQHGAALLFSPPTQSSLKHHLLPSSPAHHQALSYAHTRSQASCQAQAGVPEQNGILDWLRRLRLHKYYPVFKQLTMEEVGPGSAELPALSGFTSRF